MYETEDTCPRHVDKGIQNYEMMMAPASLTITSCLKTKRFHD